MTIQTTGTCRDGVLTLEDEVSLPANARVDVAITLRPPLKFSKEDEEAIAAFRKELEPLLFDENTPPIPADFGSDHIYDDNDEDGR